MSRSCGFANSQMEVRRERLDGTGEVSNGLLLLFLLLLLLLLMLFPKTRTEASRSGTYHVKRIEALSVSVAGRLTIIFAAILVPVLLTSCGKKGQDGEKETAQKSEDDFLDKDAKPDQRKYLVAAKPFFIAIANRKYADAYALLSSHARARMSFNQFTPADDQATFQQYESQPYSK